MEKNEEKVLERNLEQKHFENAAKAIKGGKESGSLTNVELVENLVESYSKRCNGCSYACCNYEERI